MFYHSDMKFSILIQGAPYSSQAAYSAYHFTKAALENGHQVYRVFLYQDAINIGTRLATPPQDEFNVFSAWQTLQADYKIDVVTCIAAAARRGLLDQAEAKRHEKDAHNLFEGFALSGLGQLADAHLNSDRLISFGA